MTVTTAKLRDCIFEFSFRMNTFPLNTRDKGTSAKTLQVPLVSLASLKLENLEKLGTGVSGTCYRHKFPDMEETVCIKVFKRNFLWRRGWRAMLCEAESLKRVSGIPGTPKLIAVSPVAPRAIIMSDAGTLTFLEWLSRNAGNPREVISALKKTCATLELIHGRGLSHNDLHDRNIVVNERSNEPTIVDVGNMLPFGVRTWKTMYFTKMPLRQMFWIDAVDASGDVRMMGKLIRESLSFLSPDAPFRDALRRLAQGCIRQEVTSIGDVVVKLDAILSLINNQPCDSS